MATCGTHDKPGCGARIVWARVQGTNRPIPLDPDPVEDGNVIRTSHHGGPENMIVRVLKKDETVPEHAERYRSHFATCPERASFRK